MLKKLKVGLLRYGGRNNTGQQVLRFRGGGHKRSYKLVDFKRNFVGIYAKILDIVYDPYRSADVALVGYSNGFLSYILAPAGVYVGDFVYSDDMLVKGFGVGDSAKIVNMQKGLYVHNLELRKAVGGVFMRAAGSSGVVLDKYKIGVLVKLASGEYRFFDKNCKATLGVLSNTVRKFKNKRKAGVNRLLGRRPRVRGVAMNPVDHPHGGGEGKSSGGRHCVSFKGFLTKGPVSRTREERSIVKRKRESLVLLGVRLQNLEKFKE